LLGWRKDEQMYRLEVRSAVFRDRMSVAEVSGRRWGRSDGVVGESSFAFSRVEKGGGTFAGVKGKTVDHAVGLDKGFRSGF